MGALDDLRGQIRFRGLKGSSFADPVKEFKGLFTGFDTEEAMFNKEKTGRMNVILHFAELDSSSIVSSEPYPFPNKDVTITFSEADDSRWMIFAKSGLAFLRPPKIGLDGKVEDPGEEFRNLIGRQLHLRQEPHVIFQGKEKGRIPADCWVITGVEGASAAGNGVEPTASVVSAEHQLLLLLNGRTEQQFNMEALRLPAVKGDSALTTRILNRTFFGELVGKGMVQKDDAGIYSLTEVGVAALQG